MVQIPRYLHNDPKCMQAKLKELDSWDEFRVYDEVKDVGQQTLGTNWILTEKVIDGELAVKARLCVRGDQEMESFRTDSPTVHKDSINVFFMVAAKNGWKIQTADIKCAFLQGKELDRDVFVRPPKERRIPGVIWKMLKRTYGFTDASRGFYLELSKALKDLGCIQSTLDPAVFPYFGKGKTLEGVTLTHVDDLLHGSGTDIFYENVMKPLKEIFKFGTEEVQEFRYVGMNIRQIKDAIVVDQDHYIRAMEFPDHDEQGGSKLLDSDRQSEYRSLLGRIGWLSSHTRPDLIFDHICFSTKLGKATADDYVDVIKVGKKMVASSSQIKFPALGDISKWVVEAYGDAGIRTLPDNVSSCGAQVVLIRNKDSDEVCTLSWKGRKLKRVVTSSTASETLALNDVVSKIISLKALMCELCGPDVDGIPVNLYTDSKNLVNAVNSTSMVEDPRLRLEVASLKESLQKGEVTSLIHIPGRNMLANCMTKRGASAKDLLQVIRSGRLVIGDQSQL